MEVAIGMRPSMGNIEDYMLKNDLPTLVTLMEHLDEKWSADKIETARLAELAEVVPFLLPDHSDSGGDLSGKLDGMPDEEKELH